MIEGISIKKNIMAVGILLITLGWMFILRSILSPTDDKEIIKFNKQQIEAMRNTIKYKDEIIQSKDSTIKHLQQSLNEEIKINKRLTD